MVRTFPFRDVVLIADVFDETVNADLDRRHDLEKTHSHTLRKIVEAINALGLKTHHYDSPKALAERAAYHLSDVVISIYGGANSRNRMALVPAICETFGLKYVGPDVYGRIVSQDKEVSKRLADDAGLHVARHRIVRTIGDLEYIDAFPRPYVAKPLFEGSSIGMGPRNLVGHHSSDEIVRELLNEFSQPIMVEEFIPGREVSWCFVQSNKALRSVFTELIWPGDPTHFDRNLFDAYHKLDEEKQPVIQNIDGELSPMDAASLETLLSVVGHMGYGRIDGKLRDGVFYFIEITPDAWLGPSGSLVDGFNTVGLSYPDLLAEILLSAIPSPLNQLPSDSDIPGDS